METAMLEAQKEINEQRSQAVLLAVLGEAAVETEVLSVFTRPIETLNNASETVGSSSNSNQCQNSQQCQQSYSSMSSQQSQRCSHGCHPPR